jgi:hypothetical protein
MRNIWFDGDLAGVCAHECDYLEGVSGRSENKKKLSVKGHVQQLKYTGTGFRIHQCAGLSRNKSERDGDGGTESGR